MQSRYPHAPGTTWRRAVKRVDRRARTLLAVEPVLRAADVTTGEILAVLNARADLREAVRLSNAIYMSCVHRPTGAFR